MRHVPSAERVVAVVRRRRRCGDPARGGGACGSRGHGAHGASFGVGAALHPVCVAQKATTLHESAL
ncbi:hypothetical protein FM110_11850 [Brachybacterium nesterenkovii]|uniref:Uncharacterized protein n=1 Tax=Brachybacterium nesterenkovii TaxID=47847 RepID=A0A1X6X893_9MICO|nr:hypothetical protein FM110_11850 [Brachybacterium nesterenkovii]